MNALIRAAADLQAVCRPKDWLDIEGIIVRQSAQLDWAYVRAELAPLAELKNAPDLVDKLARMQVDLS